MSVTSTFTGTDLAKDVLANGGGTYAVERNAHTGGVVITKQNLKHGYMVSRPDSESQYNVGQFDNVDLGLYVGNHLDSLTHLTAYLGAWVEDGIVYLDISDQVSTLNVALWKAVEGKQLAIFDNRNKRVIEVTDQDRITYNYNGE